MVTVHGAFLTPEGSQPLAPGRESSSVPGVHVPRSRPRRGRSAAATPPGSIPDLMLLTGGIAALNHRLIAATPPGSIPLHSLRQTRFVARNEYSLRGVVTPSRRNESEQCRLTPSLVHVPQHDPPRIPRELRLQAKTGMSNLLVFDVGQPDQHSRQPMLGQIRTTECADLASQNHVYAK